MKTVIFWYSDVIEITFALNNVPRQKDNAGTASRDFNRHRYEQGLVKYFHLP
jgi:hypothetical protein